MQEMATRLCGSADLFATDPGRGATSSINYISCHDGFTLSDLTSYMHKHNELNGEHNRDGSTTNNSANFGVKGPTDDPVVTARRERADMNMLGTLLLALGTPMMLAGDEFRNTQYGNNNAYCQDNNVTWLNWDWLIDTNKTPEFRRMESVSRLIAVRNSLDIYNHEDFFTRLTQLGLLKQSSRVQWLLADGSTPIERDWFDTTIRSFTMRLRGNEELDVLIVVNGDAADERFHLPSDVQWHLLWSSAESQGVRPAPGPRTEILSDDSGLALWAQTIPIDYKPGQSPVFPNAIIEAAERQVARARSRGAGTGAPSVDELLGQLGEDAAELPEDVHSRPAVEPQPEVPVTGVTVPPRVDTVIKVGAARSARPSTPLLHGARPRPQLPLDDDAPNVWTVPGLSINILLQEEQR